jgi:putative ABC transport system substrate-binding protein
MPIMRGPWFAVFPLLSLVLTAQVPSPPAAPPTEKRLGVFFWHESPNDEATFRGIQQGLRQSGLPHRFVEHRANADPARAAAAFTALRQARCDLVFAMGTQSTLLAREALPQVPIVFAAVSDPVASGIVPSWQGSGGNLCGGSNWIAPANVLAVFQLAVPGLQRLGMLRSEASGVVSAAEAASMRAHLAALPNGRIELVEAVCKDAAGIPAAIAALRQQRIDAIWIPIDLSIYQNVPAVQKALGDDKTPLLTTAATGVQQGALVGAVVDYSLHGRRVAAMAVDVLAHGKAPGTLPVDRLHGNLVLVNLAVARKTGIELPLSLLALADELIDPEVPNVGR